MDSYLQPNENAYTNAETRLRNFEQKRRALLINREDAKKTQYKAFVRRMQKKGYTVDPTGEVFSASGKSLGNYEDGVKEIKKIEKAVVKEDPQDKVLFGEDLMSIYGPGGAKNDPSDNYDADDITTDAIAARQQSFDPDSGFSPDMFNTSTGSSSAGTNGTSTRDRLKVAQSIKDNPTRIQRGLIDSGFTAERLADLRIKQQDFKSMNRQDFAAKYPKSQTAKRLNKKRK